MEYSVEEAIRAQRAMREAAGLGQELFPFEAFVGITLHPTNGMGSAK